MANDGSKTMAFQIPEELFRRLKRHLERESARTGRKVTQREFVLGLIQEALQAVESEGPLTPGERQEDTSEEPQQPQQ